MLPIELDVTSGESVRAAVAACEDAFGGLDALVNSAGVIRFTPLDEITEAEWDLVVGVDLKGVFLCCQAAAPLLRRSGRGRIVNLSSDAGKLGFPLISTYVTAKHGVIGLTKTLAAELAPDRVTVNCICPVGTPETTMGQDVLAAKIATTGATAEQIMAEHRRQRAHRAQQHHGRRRQRGDVPAVGRVGLHHGGHHRRRRRADQHGARPGRERQVDVSARATQGGRRNEGG